MKHRGKYIMILLLFMAIYYLDSWIYPNATKRHAPIKTKSEIAITGAKSSRLPSRYVDLGQSKIVTTPKDSESNVVFNDPAISAKWDLKKTDAAKAWQVSQGDRSIVVAIIDTGCDVDHEDLKSNIWTNPGESGPDSRGLEKASNRIDDDNNGFVDDVHGWNFVASNNSVSDHHGHGTHIAGIIGAEGGNNKGIIGIAPKVSMMILKYYEPGAATDNLKNTIQAIKYAVKMHANVINYSGGGLEFSSDEKQAILEAQQEGILFVAAAGNERSNSDHHKYFPADYKLPNIISVTAINPNTEVLASSNYGIQTVDIAAPGENILSTLPGNSYGYMTGTSQATAFVTGAAAVVMAHKGSSDDLETKKYLLATGDGEDTLVNKTGTSRKLNLYKALTILDRGTGVTGVQANNINGDNPIFSPESDLYTDSKDLKSSKDKKATLTQAQLGAFGQSLLSAVQSDKSTPSISESSGSLELSSTDPNAIASPVSTPSKATKPNNTNPSKNRSPSYRNPNR